jgi:hypothetical protein
MDTPPIFDESGRPIGGAGASAPATGTLESAPTVPSGVPASPAFQPMSLDDARALLVREHRVAIGDNDPILLSVSLHQAFCGDLEKLLAHHTKRLEALLQTTGNGFADVVEGTLESLRDKTVKASLDQSFALIAAQAEAMQTLRRRMRRFGIYQTFLSVVSLAAALLALAILTHAIR